MAGGVMQEKNEKEMPAFYSTYSSDSNPVFHVA